MEHSIFLGNLAWDVTRELVMDMVNDVLGPGLFNQGNLLLSSHLSLALGSRLVDLSREYCDPLTLQLQLTYSPRCLIRSTVRLAIDRETGRPRGFGHIDFKGSCLSHCTHVSRPLYLTSLSNAFNVNSNHFDVAILQTLRVLIAP